jgi:hypothetical protein
LSELYGSGIRGVFDGVIENMHLHWKHRELVKLISKQKTLAFVEDTARLLQYESGGILVAIERVPKGYALIYYRGKNYRRPISIRPRNLLTKAKALKRSVAMQRHEVPSFMSPFCYENAQYFASSDSGYVLNVAFMSNYCAGS